MFLMREIYNPQELSDKNNRIYYFDNLKFILILLVVIGHFLGFIIEKSNLAKSIWIFIYCFHMPLFILVSGYFSKKAIENRDYSKPLKYFILYTILKLIVYFIYMFIGEKISFKLLTTGGAEWYLLAMSLWYMFSILTKKINKKFILIISFILALIIGYDKTCGDFLVLSRTIVFYPFFLLGMIINKHTIEKITSSTKIKICSFIGLIFIIILLCYFINDIYFIRPMLFGKNSYLSLPNNIENFGFLFRILQYIVSIVLSIMFMSIIPKGKAFFTKMGTRTLTVYFLHILVMRIWNKYNINFRTLEYIVFSCLLTLVLSLKFLKLI